MLKSSLFRSFDLDDSAGKALRKDVGHLIGLEEQQIDLLCEALVEVETATTQDEKVHIVERVADAADLSLVEVAHAYRPLILFLGAFVGDSDQNTVEGLVEDMVATDLVLPEQQSAVQRIVARVHVIAKEAGPAIARARAEFRVLPNLKEFQTSVELRAVLADAYDSKTPIEEYTPRVTDTAGIISVRMRLDSGPSRDIFFQAPAAVIDHLIRHLTATQKELQALMQHAKASNIETTAPREAATAEA